MLGMLIATGGEAPSPAARRRRRSAGAPVCGARGRRGAGGGRDPAGDRRRRAGAAASGAVRSRRQSRSRRRLRGRSRVWSPRNAATTPGGRYALPVGCSAPGTSRDELPCAERAAPNHRAVATPRTSSTLRSVCEVPPAPVAAPPAGTTEVCDATSAPQSAGDVAASGNDGTRSLFSRLRLGAQRRRVETVHDDHAGVRLDRRQRRGVERERAAVVDRSLRSARW